jgi:hypothetical protein
MLLRPLTQFGFLWAILILSINNRAFIFVASVIALMSAGRAIYNLWDLLADTSSWVDKLKVGLAQQMQLKIAAIHKWNENSDPEKITNDVNTLKIYESAFSFIADNRDFLTKFTIAVATIITVPFYCYISLMFSLTYFGIAKVQGISWSWPTALSVAMYMPFAYTDLPHSFVIRMLGGLQGIAVTVMGWNIVVRNLGGRFERIVRAAIELREPFEKIDYRTKMTRISEAASFHAESPRLIPIKGARKPSKRSVGKRSKKN